MPSAIGMILLPLHLRGRYWNKEESLVNDQWLSSMHKVALYPAMPGSHLRTPKRLYSSAILMHFGEDDEQER